MCCEAPIFVRQLWRRRPGPDEYPEFEETKTWYEGLQPRPDDDAGPALDHARRLYDEQLAVDAVMERKAEWTLGLAAGAVALTLGLLPEGPLAWWSAPALVCFFLSMYLSLKVRMPGERAVPFNAREVLKLLPNGPIWQEWVAASYHAARFSIRALTNWKAACVRAAGVWLILGGVAVAPTFVCRAAFTSAGDRAAPAAGAGQLATCRTSPPAAPVEARCSG